MSDKKLLPNKTDDKNTNNQLVPQRNTAGKVETTLARDPIIEGLSTLRLRAGISIADMAAPASPAAEEPADKPFTFVELVILEYLKLNKREESETPIERDNRIQKAVWAGLGDLMETQSQGAVRLSEVEGRLNLILETAPGHPPLILSVDDFIEREAGVSSSSHGGPADDHSAQGKADKDKPAADKPAEE